MYKHVKYIQRKKWIESDSSVFSERFAVTTHLCWSWSEDWIEDSSDGVSGVQIPLGCSEFLSSAHTNEEISSRLAVLRDRKHSLLEMRYDSRRHTPHIVNTNCSTAIYKLRGWHNELILKFINSFNRNYCPQYLKNYRTLFSTSGTISLSHSENHALNYRR
jgi:hypothetical protein